MEGEEAEIVGWKAVVRITRHDKVSFFVAFDMVSRACFMQGQMWVQVEKWDFQADVLFELFC